MSNEGERLARRFYRLRGYRVLGENVWLGGNEVDLIVRRGGRLVFCEVKQKRVDRFGSPLEMVTAEKRRRVERAAEAWLARHPEAAGLDVSLECVAVSGRRVERVLVS